MKKLLPILIVCLHITALFSEARIYIGPHFNYTRLHFDNPSVLEGYMGGVALGGEYDCGFLFTALDFEGSWNAGPITGRPCQRSSLTEYFVELKLGCSRWQCCGCLNLKPYIGFGYDRFENDQDPQGMGLCYDYDKLFIPVGFYALWTLSPCVTGGLQFEWRPDVYARLNFDHSFHLDTELEHAFRVQLPFIAAFECCCNTYDLRIIPFFDWNEFGRVRDSSLSEVMVDIPELTRWNVGIRVLLGYHF